MLSLSFQFLVLAVMPHLKISKMFTLTYRNQEANYLQATPDIKPKMHVECFWKAKRNCSWPTFYKNSH